MTDEDIHNQAILAGAMVLGEEGTTQHYLFTLDQLATLLCMPAPVALPCPVAIPPCPV